MSIEDEGFLRQSRFHCLAWLLLLVRCKDILKFSLISVLQCLAINTSNKLQTRALQARERAKLSGFPKPDGEAKTERLSCLAFLFLSVLGLTEQLSSVMFSIGWASGAQCFTTSVLYSAELHNFLGRRMCNKMFEELIFQHSSECFLNLKAVYALHQITSKRDFFFPLKFILETRGM